MIDLLNSLINSLYVTRKDNPSVGVDSSYVKLTVTGLVNQSELYPLLVFK